MSRLILTGLSLVTFLGFAVSLSIPQEADPSAPGVYLLVEVNGEKLPAVSWTRSAEDRTCRTETLGGAMLLGSDGRWAALVKEREVCESRDGTKSIDEEVSMIFSGSYKISGSRIILHNETLGGSDEAVLKGDILVVEVVGVGPLEDQITKFVLKRAD